MFWRRAEQVSSRPQPNTGSGGGGGGGGCLLSDNDGAWHTDGTNNLARLEGGRPANWARGGRRTKQKQDVGHSEGAGWWAARRPSAEWISVVRVWLTTDQQERGEVHTVNKHAHLADGPRTIIDVNGGGGGRFQLRKAYLLIPSCLGPVIHQFIPSKLSDWMGAIPGAQIETITALGLVTSRITPPHRCFDQSSHIRSCMETRQGLT